MSIPCIFQVPWSLFMHLKKFSIPIKISGFWEDRQQKSEIYRVSPKKCPDVSNFHNSFKIGTRNKSRVSFEILRKSSCWWALKFFNSDNQELRKWGLKLVTLCLKAWPNHPFLRPSLPCAYWNLKHPVHLNIPLPQKKIIYDKKCFKITIKKYSNGRHQYCICF